jgi:3-oxoacyl-[acyl-carrier protein] reductase
MQENTDQAIVFAPAGVAEYPDLKGKIALVTASSRGIGLATARALCENGAKVIINGRTEKWLEASSQMLRWEGFSVSTLIGDFSNEKFVGTAAKKVLEEHGQLDILVANTGGQGALVPAETLTIEAWRSTIEVNLTSTFMAISAFLPSMLAHGSGNVVTMASTAGRQPSKASPAYGAAKAGVVMLTRQLASEFGSRGLRFNCVAPGAVLTTDSQLNHAPDNVKQMVAKSHPIPRLGSPEDIAQAVLFLVSSSSSWITGVTIDVCGGRVSA